MDSATFSHSGAVAGKINWFKAHLGMILQLASCSSQFCHLPAFVVGETSLLAFLSVIMESWTVALKRRLLELWFETKTKYETTMKKNTRKRAWILDELKKCAGEGDGRTRENHIQK